MQDKQEVNCEPSLKRTHDRIKYVAEYAYHTSETDMVSKVIEIRDKTQP